MNVIMRALSAETLKMKRTLAFWLTLLTPGALIFLEVAGITQGQARVGSIPPEVNRYTILFEDAVSIWAVLIFPLFITLETALLGQLEHGNQTWKLLHTQPIPRWAALAAKQILGLGLIALGLGALIALTVIGGGILDLLMPELLIEPPIPWKEMFTQSGILFLAGGIIMAVHTWIGLRSRSFVAASAVGIGMTIAGLIIGSFDLTPYFPWSIPALALYNYYDGLEFIRYLSFGAAGGVVLSVLANLDIRRLEIRN